MLEEILAYNKKFVEDKGCENDKKCGRRHFPSFR